MIFSLMKIKTGEECSNKAYQTLESLNTADIFI